jgi:hypothetical protein
MARSANRSAAEFCLFQYRMICELLAMGCLAVHIDVPDVNALYKRRNANDIMKRLSRLKPEYFLVAITETGKGTECEPHTHHNRTDTITQQELLRLYHFFGEQLHSGTFSRYMNRQSKAYDFALIENFVTDVVTLLNVHIYKLYSYRKLVRVIMQNADDGRVWWNELELIGPTDQEGSDGQRDDNASLTT